MSVIDLAIGAILGSAVTMIIVDVIINRRKNSPPVPPPAPTPPVEPLRGTAAPLAVLRSGRYTSGTIEPLRESQIKEQLRQISIVPEYVKNQVAAVIQMEIHSPDGFDYQRKVRITGCKDPLMWYADKVGQAFDYISIWPESGWAVRDGMGFSNVVRFNEGAIFLETKEPT